MGFYVNSQPGINASNTNFQDYNVVPINIFYEKGELATMMACAVAISGNSTDQPSNSPYDFVILPGQLFGLITSGSQQNKYGSSIIGLAQAVSSGATSITTDTNTATELVRRIGSSGTFNMTGPATAGGSVTQLPITYSNVVTSTGVITCTATAQAYVANSLIQPNDGSQAIRTVYAARYPFKVKDIYNTVRTDVTVNGLLAAGGGSVIEDAYIYQLGSGTISDPSLTAYIRASISGFANVSFRSYQQPN